MDFALHLVLALFLRLLCLLFGEYQDEYSDVKYTDVDYHVFNDAAKLVSEGRSPYERHTYRYTPFLAFMLCPNVFIHFSFGKSLFAIFDVFTGFLIYHILKNYGYSSKVSRISSFLWLYNPMASIISTRGSSESFMTTLIMTSIFCLQRRYVGFLGLIYGFAVHFKLYPCIHALTFYITLGPCRFYSVWEALVLTKQRFKFITFSALGFIAPTLLAYHWYGMNYINETFIYHIRRKDIKHNFSPYFYAAYLSDTDDSNILLDPSKLAFLYQSILLLLITWRFRFYKNVLPCLFIQTYVFVTFNKVCTSQYFLWYLCLFPLNFPLFVSYSSVIKGLTLWFIGQIIWLLPAYYLEFQGLNLFFVLWLATLVFFGINVFLICKFCKICFETLPNEISPIKKCA